MAIAVINVTHVVVEGWDTIRPLGRFHKWELELPSDTVCGLVLETPVRVSKVVAEKLLPPCKRCWK